MAAPARVAQVTCGCTHHGITRGGIQVASCCAETVRDCCCGHDFWPADKAVRERIDLADLRDACAELEGVDWHLDVPRETVLALVEAVEAARENSVHNAITFRLAVALASFGEPAA